MTTGTARSSQPAAAGSPRGASPRLVATRAGWAWVVLSSLAIAAFAVVPYLTASLAELSASGAGVADTYADLPAIVQAAFYAHIVAGGLALVAGPFQFWRGLRDRYRAVHRWIGRGYLAAVAIAGVSGLVIAPFSEAGLAGFVGFGALAVLWLVTAWRAYRAIRARDVANHRAWMMRNFALTYAAVTLRLWLGLLIGLQAIPGDFDFDAAFANAYGVVPFLAWLPNLVVAEWLIRRRGLPSYRIAMGTQAPSAARG
ncbi:DUF2306 domain-containing protein [Agromyces mariniharenae]|uniref:DUF2306 domain-containing protein n=1 Tax=Agromyces mariniharenae TaxID=2604423 RepID=A0A5S4UX30_9MICO|nr:DUF2306 domain-containing protein [Agromyces mariniharenae]TYL51122.1 DUF2306 domain-containing protein [Agromyces mariniharenae]